MVLRMHVCGRITIVGDRGSVDEHDLPGRQGRLALARLCLEQGRPVSSERLTDCLWGDVPPRDAAGALASVVSKLREPRGVSKRTRVRPSSLGLGRMSSGCLPTAALTSRTLATQSIAEGARRRDDVRAAWASATVAVSIGRRGFLPSEHGLWACGTVAAEVERLTLRGYDCLTWVWTVRGDGVMATAMAQQAIVLAPLHEPAWRALMIAQAELAAEPMPFERTDDAETR